MKKLSKRQIEMLSIVRELGGGADGWAEIYSHYETYPFQGSNPAWSLNTANFDRVGDSLLDRGFLTLDGENAEIELTAAGWRALLRAEGK